MSAGVGKPVRIFYIGDFDPAGVLIDVTAERELRRMASMLGGRHA